MKVEKVDSHETFKPVVLQITIETLEELQALNYFGSLNVSIPKVVYESATFLGAIEATKRKDLACRLLTLIEYQTRGKSQWPQCTD